MSPIVVLARTRRLILLPFAAGFDAICIAALVWLDPRKSLALEYDEAPGRQLAVIGDPAGDERLTKQTRNQNGLMQHSFATNFRRTRMQIRTLTPIG